MIFRVYHERQGGHVHCRMFSGKQDGALGKCGEFTMRTEEFDHFAWLTRSRFEFEPPNAPDENASTGGAMLTERILDQVKTRLTPNEYQRIFWVVATALDDYFELGIRAAGGTVVDLARPRPYARYEAPPPKPMPAEIAADWFTLPPSERTKDRLLAMLA